MSLTKPLWSTGKVNKASNGLPVRRDEFFGPFDDLFNDFANSFFKGSSLVQPLSLKRAYPKVNINREGNDLVLEAAVPGLGKEDLTISVENNTLVIKGESQVRGDSISDDSSPKQCYFQEIKRSSFVRRFSLPEGMDSSSVDMSKAKLENGILEIRFTNAFPSDEEKAKVKTIPIE